MSIGVWKGQGNSIPHPNNHSGDEDGDDADEQDVFNHANTIREIKGQGNSQWARQDSNLQPIDYEPTALTVELQALREKTIPLTSKLNPEDP